MRVYTFPALIAGNMSGSLTSSVFEMKNYWGAAASCITTGSAVGVLTMLGSVDDINFTPLQRNGVPLTLAVTGPGTYIFDITQTATKFLEVTYTPDTGTGTLNVTVYLKGY